MVMNIAWGESMSDRLGKRLAAIVGALGMTLAVGLVAATPASAASCTPSISSPAKDANGHVWTAGYVHGSCPSGTYRIWLYKWEGLLPTWYGKAHSPNFSVGGGNMAQTKCSTGKWMGAIIKGGDQYL